MERRTNPNSTYCNFKKAKVIDVINFLCRNSDVKTRKKYVDLVESVKDSGGEAFIFSSMHVSGERECSLLYPFFFTVPDSYTVLMNLQSWHNSLELQLFSGSLYQTSKTLRCNISSAIENNTKSYSSHYNPL